MTLRRHRGRAVDWQTVREELQRLQSAGQVAALSTEQTRAILDERARILSRPLIGSSPRDSLDVLTFAVGVERYAVETKYVKEVARLLHVTPVPGAPDLIVGVTNHRGQILSVMTLTSISASGPTALTDAARLIVMGVETPEFAVLADRTEAVASLPASDILPPSNFHTGIARQYLRGVTRSAVVVINGAQLLHDPRLFIDERETPPGQDLAGRPTPC
jgi:purine-binding chemotaxis protein CheW